MTTTGTGTAPPEPTATEDHPHADAATDRADTDGTDTDGTETGRAGTAAAWELPARATAASRARRLTARALRDWHVTDPADTGDIVLMVDELVTNAVVHGSGPVRLALRLDGTLLTAEVSDADPAPPAAPGGPPRVLDWSEAGRGLLLVVALATAFGALPHPPGKTVWFTRRLTPPPGTAPAGTLSADGAPADGAAVPAPRRPAPGAAP
ncbi:ATP-binding protein [Actinomadura monticuli]|uniref:ATP-binding protein n=1 Tax=Actinomadura monticuli TaxID=3097367 RepID=A0ABV4QKH2_9ACTN